MAEISLDSDTNIKDLDDSTQRSVASSSKTPRSVVVMIPLEKLGKASTSKAEDKAKASSSTRSKNSSTSQSSSSTTVSSQKKKELLKKAQVAKEKLVKEKEREKSTTAKSKVDMTDKGKDTPSVPEPHPVPENFNIPRLSQEPSTSNSNAREDRHDDSRTTPRRSKSPRSSSRREGRGSSRSARSRTPRRTRSRSTSRRRSRSPYYRRRRSPSRSRSREFRPFFARSPRRRTPSPCFRRRSPPPRAYRPRERSYSRSPSRYGPPRWQRGEDRFAGPRDDGFNRPPHRGEFNGSWDRGIQSHPPGFPPGFSRGQSDFQGFGDHFEQWGVPPSLPTQSQPITAPREVVAGPASQLLSIPAEMLAPPPQQSIIDSLKEEIKGLSQTMLSITSQMGNATKSNTDVIQNTDRQPVHTDSRLTDKTVVSTEAVAGPSSEVASVCTDVSSRSAGRQVYAAQQETDDMEVSSDSEGDSSEGEYSSENESGEDSDSPPVFKTPEGFLDWATLNRLIVAKFPDRISPEESTDTVARIENLGGLSEKKEVERLRLPMFGAIRVELNNLARDVKAPPSKAKARRDTKPLGRGAFPEATKGLPIQALSEDLRFNQPAQTDTGVERLLPLKKSSYNIQGRFSDEHLRKMERDLRVTLSTLSYVLWALDFTTQSLIEKSASMKDKDSLLACISACKHSMSFLTTTVDRSATTLATTVLARRDSFLSQMDPLLPEEDQISLRGSSFLDTSLFAGNIVDLIPKIEGLRRESQSRESVDVLTSLAKKGVEGSSSKKAYTGSGYSKKKSSKKQSKKKGSKKFNAPSTTTTATTEQSSTGGIQRTFRNKQKKSKK